MRAGWVEKEEKITIDDEEAEDGKNYKRKSLALRNSPEKWPGKHARIIYIYIASLAPPPHQPVPFPCTYNRNCKYVRVSNNISHTNMCDDIIVIVVVVRCGLTDAVKKYLRAFAIRIIIRYLCERTHSEQILMLLFSFALFDRAPHTIYTILLVYVCSIICIIMLFFFRLLLSLLLLISAWQNVCSGKIIDTCLPYAIIANSQVSIHCDTQFVTFSRIYVHYVPVTECWAPTLTPPCIMYQAYPIYSSAASVYMYRTVSRIRNNDVHGKPEIKWNRE